MNEQQNIQLAQRGYAFFRDGDITNLLNLHAEDVEYVFPGPPDMIPYAGTYKGKEQVRQFFYRVSEAIDFQQFEPKEFFAQGDKVVVLGRSQGKIKSTGRTLTDEWAHVFTMTNGSVSRLQMYVDTALTVEGFKQESAQAVL